MYEICLIAEDEKGTLHTIEHPSFKDYLVAENHLHYKGKWKFIKAICYGEQLQNIPNGNIGVNYFRDIWDFNIYSRHHNERKRLEVEVPNEILHKFLLETHSNTKSLIQQTIKKGAKNINKFFDNGGCGKCEYRPNHISGYDFFHAKGVVIKWINNDADICEGMVSRNVIFKEIQYLIEQGIYLYDKPNTKPKIEFIEDRKQLKGQMNILDWLGGNNAQS